METIRNYLDNMFSSLPKSPEIENLKKELLLNMEDKYNELKASGKSENESIGIVISEFGNIDELITELGIDVSSKESTIIIDQEEALKYLNAKKHSSFLVSIGVSLCIIGAALLILVSDLAERRVILGNFSDNAISTISLAPLFILLVPAIALFIYSGVKLEKYKFIEKGEFSLSFQGKTFLEKELENYHSKYTTGIITGVSLCILSPFCVLIGDSISEEATIYGTVLLLFVISIAVFIFINVGSFKEGCKALLKLEDYSPQNRENNKVIGAVASVVWPLTVCIYLIISFVYNLWHISWIVFPVVGILFGGFCAVYNAVKTRS